jgi:hypothetical protein
VVTCGLKRLVQLVSAVRVGNDHFTGHQNGIPILTGLANDALVFAKP